MPMQQKAHFRVPPLDTAVLNAFDCVLQASQELQDNAIGLYDVKLTKYQLSSLQVGTVVVVLMAGCVLLGY